MRKIKNPFLHKDGYNCFACSPDNPIGLHMEFFEDGEDIVSYWHPQMSYQGWSGVMHGGILSTLIDETSGWVVTRKLQTAGMTTRLEVRYRRPVMADDTLLTIRSHITQQTGNRVKISSTIENSKGDVCVQGEADYFVFDEERAGKMGFSHCDVEDEQLLSM